MQRKGFVPAALNSLSWRAKPVKGFPVASESREEVARLRPRSLVLGACLIPLVSLWVAAMAGMLACPLATHLWLGPVDRPGATTTPLMRQPGAPAAPPARGASRPLGAGAVQAAPTGPADALGRLAAWTNYPTCVRAIGTGRVCPSASLAEPWLF